MSGIQKGKSRITEDLTTLYLRLNGYFTTGFMLHSAERGKIETEIDCIGVRFPHSGEPDRGIGPDTFLEPSGVYIDLVLCEVKSFGQPLQFNKAVRKDVDRFKRVLRWAGMFTEPQLQKLGPDLLTALTPRAVASLKIPEVVFEDKVRIRGLVFSPERDVSARNGNEPFFVGGDTMLDYAWRCLCPLAPRATCGTIYDYTSWGHLEPIVRYFKGRGTSSAGSINDLYQFLLSGGNK